MALTKVNRGGLNTGVSDSSNATFLTVDSSEQAVIKSEGGAVTTSVQQGLCKHFCHWDGSGTIEVDDSFNQSGLTDDATGRTTVAITNNMNNIHYTVTGSTIGSDGSFFAFMCGNNAVHTTSQYKVISFHHTSGAVDLIHNQCQLVGDLA